MVYLPQAIFPATIKASPEGIKNTNSYRICKVGPSGRANVEIHACLITIDIVSPGLRERAQRLYYPSYLFHPNPPHLKARRRPGFNRNHPYSLYNLMSFVSHHIPRHPSLCPPDTLETVEAKKPDPKSQLTPEDLNIATNNSGFEAVPDPGDPGWPLVSASYP